MDPTFAAVVEIVAKGGIVALCVVVMVFQWKRDERTAKENAEREARNAAAFEKLNDRHAAQTEKVISVMTELTAATKALHEEVRERPCVAEPTININGRSH